MIVIADIAVTVLLLPGAGFALIGSWGLVRLPSTMERLHGATMRGVVALLLASVVYFQARPGIWTAHELLISLVLFITVPISANMIAEVHLHRLRVGAAGEPDSTAGPPPSLGGEDGWATFAMPKRDTPASIANS